MKKLMQNKLAAIQKEIEMYRALSSFKKEYDELVAQEAIILTIMDEYEAQYKKPFIRDIEMDYNMGMISLDEMKARKNSIQVEY